MLSRIPILKVGVVASSSLVNAWQSVVETGRARTERDALAPNRRTSGPGGRLDRIHPEECWILLGTTMLGRLGFTAHSGHPVILPVNYMVVDRTIYIRSGRGPKLGAAERGDRVAFEVDQIDPDTRKGWSVSVTGRARWVRQPTDLARLGLAELQPWAAGPREHIIAIQAIHIDGRRLAAPES
jgi:nitroimidazol reductase NimA-like FMN-containing flavoprotein (pyridoxamine 5'-phosphate oxidase superfamily)